MAVVQKTGWKLVYLVVMAGLLLRTSHNQNTSQVKVVEEDERKLLALLQDTNFGFEIESTIKEEEEDQSGISLLRPDIEPSEKDLEAPNEEKKNSSQTLIPESILQFADFVDQYEPPPQQQTVDVVAFEVNLQDMMIAQQKQQSQQECQKDFQNFGRTSFNAVGIIRISLLDGKYKYCTGTLMGNNKVITSAECYPLEKNAAGFQYQPSWVCDTVWLTLTAIYIPDKWIESQTNHNIAIFFLQNPLTDAPKIGFNIGELQTQQCYITLVGWIFSESGEKQYKMVTCPNLPNFKEKLGIKSENCGEISCNLDDMDFQTGSPIILTCPNPIKHTVIGVLHMREDNETKIQVPSITPKKFAFPYMFKLEDFKDIKERVETGVP